MLFPLLRKLRLVCNTHEPVLITGVFADEPKLMPLVPATAMLVKLLANVIGAPPSERSAENVVPLMQIGPVPKELALLK